MLTFHLFDLQMFSIASSGLLIVAVTILFLYLYFTRNFNYWKNKNVCYVHPTPFFGNIFNVFVLKKSIGEHISDLYRQTNQPYLGFFVFDQPYLLVRDSALFKQCLITAFDHFSDRSITDNQRDDKLGSGILFIMKNPLWKIVRTKVAAIFATGKMRSLLPLMLEASKDLTEYLETKAIHKNFIDAREMSMKFTTDLISSCVFGINARCFHNEKAEFREASRRIFDGDIIRKIQMACYFVAPTLVKMFRMKYLEPKAVNFLEKVFNKTVTDRITSKTYKGDIVDYLVQLKEQKCNSAQKLDDDVFISQAIQFFIGGYETTGSTISFSLHCLSIFPHVQVQLREEIRRAIKKHGGVTYEAIQEMDYLDMTIKETLRMYPVISFLDRRCTKSYNFPGTDVTVEKGVPIYISLLGLHFDPKYFPNPEVFEPERFTFENRSNRPTYVYMPFGEGPRNCIGARFGILGAKIGLIQILKDFEVEPYGDQHFPLQHDPKGVVIAPKGHSISLHFKRYVSKTED